MIFLGKLERCSSVGRSRQLYYLSISAPFPSYTLQHTTLMRWGSVYSSIPSSAPVTASCISWSAAPPFSCCTLDILDRVDCDFRLKLYARSFALQKFDSCRSATGRFFATKSKVILSAGRLKHLDRFYGDFLLTKEQDDRSTGTEDTRSHSIYCTITTQVMPDNTISLYKHFKNVSNLRRKELS